MTGRQSRGVTTHAEALDALSGDVGDEVKVLLEMKHNEIIGLCDGGDQQVRH